MKQKCTNLWLSPALALFRRTEKKGSVSAVIAAAGDSVRFGRPKPFVQVASHFLFEYSLEAFLASPYVGEVVLAVRKEDEEQAKAILAKRFSAKPVKICIGGDTRDESVLRAFRVLSEQTRFVAFHDAARPLIRTADIDRVIEDAFRCGAASAGSRVVDSVKRVDSAGYISEDIARENLIAVSTPQIFYKDLYETARAVCKRDGFSSTDDNAYVSHAGFRVHITDVSFNPKLTYPGDLALIERHLISTQGDLTCS